VDNPNRLQEIDGRKVEAFVFVVVLCICGVLACVFVGGGVGAGRGGEIRELDCRVNPNDAPLASLVRLPGVGLVRAAAIVAYKENFVETGEGAVAFESPEDLQKVKGIGPKTAEGMKKLLKFERKDG